MKKFLSILAFIGLSSSALATSGNYDTVDFNKMQEAGAVAYSKFIASPPQQQKPTNMECMFITVYLEMQCFNNKTACENKGYDQETCDEEFDKCMLGTAAVCISCILPGLPHPTVPHTN